MLAGWVESSRIALRNVLRGGGALTLLYLGSVGVVTPFESSAALDSALLSAHQQGQMVLSVFWGLVGVATIVVGLQRDEDVLRLAGLGLLGVTVAKVFLLDLATMTRPATAWCPSSGSGYCCWWARSCGSGCGRAP